MNVSDLARRLRVTPMDLLEKLPALGFDIGRRAIKIDDVLAEKIFQKWMENERRQRIRNSLVANANKGQEARDPASFKQIKLPQVVVVREFAGILHLPVTKVIQELMKAGILASQNERLDFETAAIIAEDLGFKAELETADQNKAQETMSVDRIKEVIESEKVETLVARPPVIVVMGHVDHGKTRILDAIRNTHVMEKEAGGITQHIGAYTVTRKDHPLTFIDTPGHEAFTVMRSRGAKVADIAILVVAADDGVQPQTKEAYNIIQAAKLPFVVALNKMDKDTADPDRVLAQLAEIGVNTDAWGGQVPLAKVSARTGLGMDELLDVLLLVSEMNADKIRANPTRLALGTVIESHLDKGEGPVATVLVQTGTLHRNDYLGIGGAAYGRVRAMRDWMGKMTDAGTPGMPVKLLGFKVLPSVGDIFEVPEDPSKLEAKKVRTVMQVTSQLSTARMAEPEQKAEDGKKIFHVVVKCDTLGSLEALLGLMEKVDFPDIGVEVVQKGLGNVNESDISRAETTKPSVVYAFSVMIPQPIAVLAREKGVETKTTKIIYEIMDDVLARLNALVPPEVIVTPLGTFETVAIFRTESGRMVVGGKVRDGKILTGSKARVWRGEDPIGEGLIETVQIGKSAVKEAMGGQECGLSFKGKTKIQLGDRLEIYQEEVKERKIVMPR